MCHQCCFDRFERLKNDDFFEYITVVLCRLMTTFIGHDDSRIELKTTPIIHHYCVRLM